MLSETDKSSRDISIDVQLSQPQMDFCNATERECAFFGGIGSGKTWILVHHFIELAATRPNTVGMIVAPVNHMLRETVLETAKDQFRRYYPDLLKSYKLSPPMEVEVYSCDPNTGETGTSKILLRSAEEPDLLRGLNLSFCGLDEAALMKRSVYEICLGRLRQPGYPPLLRIVSTPRGRAWLYDAFVREPIAGRRLIRCATMANRSNLPPDYIRSLEQQYSGRFRAQELEGEFIKLEGLVYDVFDIKTHVRPPPDDYDITSFKHIWAGVDWGATHPSVIELVAEDYQGFMWVIGEWHKLETLPDDVVQAAKEIADECQPTGNLVRFCVDPSAKMIWKMIGRTKDSYDRLMSAEPADNDVEDGIISVRTMLTMRDGVPGLFISPDCPKLIEALGAYSYEENASEKAHPEPMHDHSDPCDALRYAIQTNQLALRKRPKGAPENYKNSDRPPEQPLPELPDQDYEMMHRHYNLPSWSQ